MKLEEAKEGLKRFCEYEDSIVLTDNALYEIQELIETVLQALDNSISKDKVREIVDECIPKKKNILTEKEEYVLDTNSGMYLAEKIVKLLEDK